MFTSLAVFAAALSSAAQPELIPLQPQPHIVAPAPFDPTSVSYYRTSMYDRWQYYAVDRTGHFRPRVVLDYPDVYQLSNGKPYPFLPIRQRDYIPYIMD